MNTQSPHVDSFSRSRISGGSTPTPINQPGFAAIDSFGGNYLYVKQMPQNYLEHQPNSSPYRQGHIISQNKQAPEGYVCVGRVMDAEHKSPPHVPSTTQKKHALKYVERSPSEVYDSPQQKYLNIGITSSTLSEFPQSFNPRMTSNMPVQEKVSTWIQKVPAHFQDLGDSFPKCYPGVIPSSSESGYEMIDNSEAQDIIEFQARRVTQYVTQIYKNEIETVAHCETSDIDYELNLPFGPEDLMLVEHSVDNYLGLEGSRMRSQEDRPWKSST